MASGSFAAVAALLFPTSGNFRGLMMISSFAKFGKSDLHTAARAGALCMVVRSHDWRPAAGDKVRHAVCRVPSATQNYQDSSSVSAREDEGQDISNFVTTNNIDSIGPKNQVIVQVFEDPWVERIPIVPSRHIHGSHKLPPGYSLAVVPGSAEFDFNTDSAQDLIISSNYNLVKILVSGAQSLFTSITLYRARGDQIDRYGFAAFGLTVAPYAVMSIVNLLGSVMVPSYPTMYIVGSSISDEARRRHGCHIDGFVSRLIEPVEDNTSVLRSKNTHFFWIRDPVYFERDYEENNDMDIYDAKDNNTEESLKFSFETSIDQHLGLQCVHQESMSQPKPNTLVELQPAKAEFCFSMKNKVRLPLKRHPLSQRYQPQTRERGRGAHIKTSGRGSRQRIQNNTIGENLKVETQDDAVVFVPDSPMINKTTKDQGGLPPYDIAVRLWKFQKGQNTVHFESAGVILKYSHPILWLGVLIICSIPLGIVGSLSGFKRQSATLSQAVWTMTWLVYGSVVGVYGMSSSGIMANDREYQERFYPDLKSLMALNLFWMFVLAVPAIGGFVVVGQMLAAYGTCYRFT